MMQAFWDQRYSEAGFAYGTEPNDFLREVAGQIPKGTVLCLGEGQGRNSVFLAGLGYDVEAVDQSAVGLAKAQSLAQERGVVLRTVTADLMDYDQGEGRWQGIVSIFCHLPSEVRRAVHRRVVRALAPGGLVVVEAYSPEQLSRNTGGPKDVNLLYRLEDLLEDFQGLVVEGAEAKVRSVFEGPFHRGEGAVVQFLGRKPLAARG